MFVFAAIAVIAVLVAIHELGHFLAARLQGIHVNRFSLGFGPILWKYQGAETEYAVRAIPLGGFVGFPDDDPDSEIPPHDPNLLKNRPILDRAIVISAGVIANLVFAYLVFVVQFATVSVPEFTPQQGIIVAEVMEQDGPASAAGLQAGDVIVAVNDEPLGVSETTVPEFTDLIRNSENQAVDLSIVRDGQDLELTVVPERNQSDKVAIGVKLQPKGALEYRRADNILNIFTMAAQEFQDMLVVTAQGFYMLVTNFSEMASNVAGPVGIVEQGAGLASDNALSLFPFTAIISINLAIINILPLPALDGGQLAFLLIEALRGRPLPERLQENVMQTGLVLLLGLGIFLIVRDTTQLDIFQHLPQ